ncbi:MAG: class I SAM-dependent methyltransferase [Gammaproteobacteria bacterium]|jgi:16S rRNA (guanine1516-N2)-methyltransferase
MHAIAQPDSAGTPGLLVSDPAGDGRAAALESRFGFARLTAPPRCGFYLELAAVGLQLRQAGPGAPGPIRTDFLSGALAHRLRYGGGRGQPLARAVGMKPGFSPSIWDATAGLARDALVLASLGSRVTLCERAPVLAALLEDALQRASGDTRAGPWLGRMHVCFADSVEALAALPAVEHPDVVYLDPMYPPGKAGVLVKKEMRTLQLLLGADRDSADLLEAGLATAARRVVVKRPRRAGWLAQKPPSASIESRNTRYDLYVTL